MAFNSSVVELSTNTIHNYTLIEKCPIMACEYHQICWMGDSAKLSLLTLWLLDLVVMVELSANTEIIPPYLKNALLWRVNIIKYAG